MSRSFDLAKPIEFLGETITVVTVQDPRFGDIKKAAGLMHRQNMAPAEAAAELLPKLTGLSAGAIDQLSARDGLAMVAHVVGFFEITLTDGES